MGKSGYFDGELGEPIDVDELTEKSISEISTIGGTLVVCPIVGRSLERKSEKTKLEEALGLAEAINLDVVDGFILHLSKISPKTLLGMGKVSEIAEVVKREGIALIIVDHALSPVQQRNLEKAWQAKVIDRTGLILEIFGARAQTREGVLQVELAHLEYQKSRLVRSWTHLERQRGGGGFLGGPGERQIESDRRALRTRISAIKKQLEKVERTRELHRSARHKVPFPVVALVGYTNAGKSSLFNALTKESIFAEDMLFATLDPTMRTVILPSKAHIILSDTVGFISDLPHELVAAFRATLEELVAADVIIHVRDFSSDQVEQQKADVLDVLRTLGIEEGGAKPIIECYNKIDLIDEESKVWVEGLAARKADVAATSALTGEGLDDLRTKIDAIFSKDDHTYSCSLKYDEGEALGWIHKNAKNVQTRDAGGAGYQMLFSLSEAKAGHFAKHFKKSLKKIK